MDSQTRIKIENGQVTDRIQKQQIKAPSGREVMSDDDISAVWSIIKEQA